ncbi:MAG: glycoside hydrolase family 57 [Lentisphaeria bacterium]|jgi:hypothetical protein
MTKRPQIVFLPHGNIQYSQLAPERRGWVIENSYEKLFDLVAKGGYRIGFEASGETIAAIARLSPRVLGKLRSLVKGGQIEAVGSPYTHIMLSNIAPEIGLETLKHGLDAWERHVGVRPTTGWNPECGWASYVPEIFKAAGFKSLVMDADSFLLSVPEVREATGLKFDVRGHSNKSQLFRIEQYIADKPRFIRHLTNPSQFQGLSLIFRSDMMSNFMLWYLMGATEEMRDTPVSVAEIRDMLRRWKERVAACGSFIMPYAEDAEYIGTSAYFYVKQFGQARFFEPEPGSVTRFQQLLDTAIAEGYELATPSEAIARGTALGENPDILNIENGVAWHGGTAKAWTNTTYSRILDPTCRSVFDGLKAVAAQLGRDIQTLDGDLRSALQRLTSAYVSDSRWPPAPTSPGRFNVQESIADLLAANDAIAAAMQKHGLAQRRSLYSPQLMATQIRAIEAELMAMAYFGEKATTEGKATRAATAASVP